MLCKRIGKGNEISYIETFMLLHLEERSQRVTTWDQKPLPWQDNFSVLISCMRLGVSPRLEVSDSNCTTGALGNFDSGDVDDWLSDTTLLCKLNAQVTFLQEEFDISVPPGHFWLLPQYGGTSVPFGELWFQFGEFSSEGKPYLALWTKVTGLMWLGSHVWGLFAIWLWVWRSDDGVLV